MLPQVEELRQRLEEKNRTIEKKTQATLQAGQERSRLSSELNETRDHLDIKDRKINVLQRKVPRLRAVQVSLVCPTRVRFSFVACRCVKTRIKHVMTILVLTIAIGHIGRKQYAHRRAYKNTQTKGIVF